MALALILSSCVFVTAALADSGGGSTSGGDAAGASGAESLDAVLDRVWGRNDMRAVSPRENFGASGRLIITPSIGVAPTDDFRTYFPIALDISYRFVSVDGLGVMLRASSSSMWVATTLSDFIDDHQGHVSASSLGDRRIADVVAGVTYHPVYGKSSVSVGRDIHFDWGVIAGMGVAISETPDGGYAGLETGAHFEALFGMQSGIYFLDWLAVRLEATLGVYHVPTQWVVPCALSVGVSFLLPEF